MARHKRLLIEPAGSFADIPPPLARPEPPAPRAGRPGRRSEAESPARLLQAGVAAGVDASSETRWSPRRTLGFVVLTNGAFWTAVGLGVWAVATR